MKQGVIETIVGFFVIIVALTFLSFAYNTSNVAKTANGYRLSASFQDAEGIAQGADVKLAGVKVGYVESLDLDSNTYFATINLIIDQKVEIPEDSRAIVSTSGLFGGKYIRINPGASDDILKAEGKFKFTQSALNIEDLIGKLVYSMTSK